MLSPGASRSPRTGLAGRGPGGPGGVQGWKMNCIRPAPPTRSFFQADKRNTLRRKGLVCSDIAAPQSDIACLEVEQSSYEDDLQILRVIEAYCFSKQRQTITNSGETEAPPSPGVKLTRLTLNLSHDNSWFPFFPLFSTKLTT